MKSRIALGLAILCWASSIFGQSNSAAPSAVVPPVVRFAGTLSTSNQTLGVTFTLYKDQTGGAPLWLETQNVSLDSNGRYTVNLGANHAGGLPAELFAAGEARWLGVQPEGEAELPRVLLVSVPYAMKAADSDTLGGLPASSYVTAEQLQNQFSVASSQSPVTSHSNASGNVSEVTPSPCTAVTSDGTALANYLTKFTAPCNVENSGLYQSASAATPGFIGIGTTTPIAPLHLQPAAQTGTSGGLSGEYLIANFNPTANSTGNYYGVYGQANSSTGNTTNFTGDIVGSGFIAQHYGTGTVTNLYGANYSVQNRAGGTVTNAVGFYGAVNNFSTGTITNGYGLQIPVPQNSGGGVFTNFYGVYIANPTGITNSWGLYSLANTNYMSGKLGIGVTAPTKSLEINGSIKLDTVGNGITYPDGTVQTTASVPGTGTITGVTAGTDLTGGGTSGKVIVNLDTTKVPTLAATSNTFTGTGGITAVSFTGSGTGLTNVDAAELGGVAASGYPQLNANNSFLGSQNITVDTSASAMQLTNTNTTAVGAQAIYATSAAPSGIGVYGEADNGATAYGVEGYSANGYGMVGNGAVYGGSFTAAGTGVYGETTGTGPSYGVWGLTENSASGSAGVYGEGVGASAVAVGRGDPPFGVWGDTNSSSGTGVFGSSDSGAAGLFINNSQLLDTLAVFNLASGGPVAEFYNESTGASCTIDGSGNVHCTGTVTGTVAGVQLEHPLDPANKYLNLASVESPEMVSVSSGNAILDGIGEAVVRLPTWFVAANGDFRYQLTAVGAPFAPYIAEKIANGHFKIAGGLPGKEVSWQVTGVRQDAFAKAHPLEVEVEKPERERGLYNHPELYGAPREKQVAWSHHKQPRNLVPVPHPATPLRPVPRQSQQLRPIAQNAAAKAAHP